MQTYVEKLPRIWTRRCLFLFIKVYLPLHQLSISCKSVTKRQVHLLVYMFIHLRKLSKPFCAIFFSSICLVKRKFWFDVMMEMSSGYCYKTNWKKINFFLNSCGHVIVTIPLGVLKLHNHTLFTPKLDQEKLTVINSISDNAICYLTYMQNLICEL